MIYAAPGVMEFYAVSSDEMVLIFYYFEHIKIFKYKDILQQFIIDRSLNQYQVKRVNFGN